MCRRTAAPPFAFRVCLSGPLVASQAEVTWGRGVYEEPCSSPINHWGAKPSNDTQPITMWAWVHCRP
eukprot:6895313-Prymnesium_polylepis.1